MDSVSGFPTSGAIIVGSEIITYTGISSNNLTGATRGAQGTRRTSHSDGAFVSLATLQKIWQGPDMTWASGSGNTRTSWVIAEHQQMHNVQDGDGQQALSNFCGTIEV